MSVVINGDTGISGVNGSAATPALQGGDADTGIFFGTNTASISTGGTSRLSIDSSGNATFFNHATAGGAFIHGSLSPGGGGGGYVSKDEIAQYAFSSSSNLFRGWDASGSSNVNVVSIKANGAAQFGTGVPGGSGVAGTFVSGAGTIETQAASGNVFIGRQGSTGVATSTIGQDGQAGFTKLLVNASTNSQNNLLLVNGRTKTGWFTCDEASKVVTAGNTAVLTIEGSNPTVVKVYITLNFAFNGGLQAHFDYDILTCDSTASGGGAGIRQSLNESVGAFQVSSSDFAVTRSSNNIIITYTAQSAGDNNVYFYVNGKFNKLSIA